MKAIPIIPLIASGLISCSSVSYTENPDGSRRVKRTDLGRDTIGESLDVSALGFKYSVEQQDESNSFKGLVNATERAIIAGILSAVTKNASDNNASVETTRVKGQSATDQAAIASTTERAAIRAGTEELKAIEETKRILAP